MKLPLNKIRKLGLRVTTQTPTTGEMITLVLDSDKNSFYLIANRALSIDSFGKRVKVVLGLVGGMIDPLWFGYTPYHPELILRRKRFMKGGLGIEQSCKSVSG